MDLSELDALLDSARMPEATVDLCLRGDLQAEWETLDRQLAEAKNAAGRTLAGTSDEGELSRRILDLEDEMSRATVTLRLRGLPRAEFRELSAKHPPRKDNQADRVLQVNQETFFDALIGACLVEPELDEQRLSSLLDKITDAQFDKLANAAWSLNRKDVETPFSRNVSRSNTSSGGTSKPRSGSGSPRSGSAGGSRKKS